MIKRYRTVSEVNLTKQFKVDNRNILVEFIGGKRFPKVVMGRFVTDDAKLQKAIESNRAYGVQFVIDKIEEMSANKSQNNLKMKIVEDVCSKQLALEWIENNLNTALSKESTDKQIRDFLLANNILMVNWK